MANFEWGVGTKDVLARAPHVTIAPASSEDPAPPAGGVWKAERAVDAQVTLADVESFIGQVGDDVHGRLLRRLYIKSEEIRAAIEGSAKALVIIGAAATTISAVFPAKAGTNDQSSYSAELWEQFHAGIDDLSKLIDKTIDDQTNPDTGGPTEPKAGLVGSMFREATVKDVQMW